MPAEHANEYIAMPPELLEALFEAFLESRELPEPSLAQLGKIIEESIREQYPGSPGVAPPMAVMEFRRMLRQESDRGCALAAASYLDVALQDLLRAYLIDDAKATEELLEGNGPLASFSARIDMAYALGLIGPRAWRDLHLVRKIRNDFAHHPGQVRFDQDAIAQRCREMYHDGLQEQLPARAKFLRVTMGLLGVIHGKTNRIQRLQAATDPDLTDASSLTRFNQVKKTMHDRLLKFAETTKGTSV